MVRRLTAALVTSVTVSLLGVLLGAAPASSGGEGRPGVTRTEIRVGGVATVTGNAGVRYASAFDGVEAYFERVNREGGVFDRRLRLVARIDDGGAASRNIAANRRLATQGKVFAVLPESTRTFAGAGQLVAAGIPTFGWNVGLEWARGPNLFGDVGSYRCFSCPAVAPAFAAAQLGVKRVAVLAPASPQAVDCGAGFRAGFERYGFDVAVAETALDPDLSRLGDVIDLVRERSVELVATCRLDLARVRSVTRALQEAELDAVHVYADGIYDPRAVKRSDSELRGVFTGVGFVPWEAPRSSAGTKAFLAAMERRDERPTPAAHAGWINAALLVEGIKAAGRGFTQQSVVEAINAMTDFRAEGILPGLSWAAGGHGPGREQCTAFVEVVRGRFRLRFAEAAQPFVCFPDNPVPGRLDRPSYKPVAGQP